MYRITTKINQRVTIAHEGNVVQVKRAIGKNNFLVLTINGQEVLIGNDRRGALMFEADKSVAFIKEEDFEKTKEPDVSKN